MRKTTISREHSSLDLQTRIALIMFARDSRNIKNIYYVKLCYSSMYVYVCTTLYVRIQLCMCILRIYLKYIYIYILNCIKLFIKLVIDIELRVYHIKQVNAYVNILSSLEH